MPCTLHDTTESRQTGMLIRRFILIKLTFILLKIHCFIGFGIHENDIKNLMFIFLIHTIEWHAIANGLGFWYFFFILICWCSTHRIDNQKEFPECCTIYLIGLFKVIIDGSMHSWNDSSVLVHLNNTIFKINCCVK